MNTYIYKEEQTKGKTNRLITAYRIRGNRPEFMGRSAENTAYWKGAKAVASNIIAEKMRYRITDGYHIDREDVELFEI